MVNCLEQDFIPKEVLSNWKRPLFKEGYGMNLCYELKIWVDYILDICKMENLKNE